MSALFCLLIFAGVLARLNRYQNRALDLGMKFGIACIAVQLARLAAAALKG